jgi:molybdate transport system ATP-binding protein
VVTEPASGAVAAGPAPVLSLDLLVQLGEFRLEFAAEFGDGITAIFGPSGSGKTTTLRCIAGLLTPDRGEIAVGGDPLFSTRLGVNTPPERRRVGLVFQEGALFPHLPVIENIRYGYRLTAAADRRIDIDRLVQLLDLGGLAERAVDTLSGGERQRVALARALAVSPGLLLLDEPIASLDARLRGVVLGYLREVHRELGVPMVYVSHNASEVLALADAVLVLRDGEEAGFGRPSRLLLGSSAAGFHPGESVENLLKGSVLEPGEGASPARVRVGEAEFITPPVTASAGEEVTVSIGANEIILAADEPGRLSARNVIRGRCLEVQASDGRVFATVDIGATVYVELTAGAVSELAIEPGREVFLVFKTSSIVVMPAAPAVAIS